MTESAAFAQLLATDTLELLQKRFCTHLYEPEPDICFLFYEWLP